MVDKIPSLSKKQSAIKSSSVLGWIDEFWRKKMAPQLVIVFFAVLLSNGSYIIITISKNPNERPWILVIAIAIECFMLGLSVVIPIVVYIKKKLIEQLNRRIEEINKNPIHSASIVYEGDAQKKKLLYSLLEVEEEYDKRNCIKRRTTKINIRNIGGVPIDCLPLFLAKKDINGVERALFIDKAPRNFSGPHMVLRLLRGDGTFEIKKSNYMFHQATHFVDFNFKYKLNPHSTRTKCIVYEYEYHNIEPDNRTSDELAYYIYKGEVVEEGCMKFIVTFSKDAYPSEAAPTAWSPNNKEKIPGYSARFPEDIPRSRSRKVIKFLWPERIETSQESYGYGLKWYWDKKRRLVK